MMSTRILPRSRSPVALPFGPLTITLGLLAGLGVSPPQAKAQNFPFDGGVVSTAPGVVIDPDGKVAVREVDTKQELAAVRARAKAGADAAKSEKLAYVSLPKLFAAVQAHLAAGKKTADLPEEVRFLGGLTQVRYVLVDPEGHDLVIAGPAEPWRVLPPAPGAPAQVMYAVGRKTGRPVLQLDDLVVAMRTMWKPGAGQFGCGIWPQPDSIQKAQAVVNQYATASRAARLKALHDALGPQDVKIFGTQPDTRLAFICVAADYKLKRVGLGLDVIPMTTVGNAVDNSRSAANMVWFELAYEPLLVSPDGNAFELRGNRLKVGAGQFNFDPRGATDKAKAFCKKFSDTMPAMATAESLFAELQNIADLGMVATLIRTDHLDRKVGWDAGWLLNEGDSATAYPVAKVPVAKTADTCVSAVNGSLACGGVVLVPGNLVGPKDRAKDDKGTLQAPIKERQSLRQSAGEKAVVTAH